MTIAKFYKLLSTFKLTDEMKILVDGVEKDIDTVVRKKTENPRFLQHKAVLVPDHGDLL